MIKSMTGFASVDRELDTATVGVTVRSVNHRHLDVQVRLSSRLASQEGELRGLVQKWVVRGRVELAVTIRASPAPVVKATLNEPLVEALAKAMGKAQERGLASGGLTAGVSAAAGPPIVLMGLKQQWPVESFRATLFCFFLNISNTQMSDNNRR